DVDVVPRFRVELVEVRTPGRILEGNPVRGDRKRMRSVVRGIRVDVRIVAGWIDRGQRRLPVTGAKTERHGYPDCDHRGDDREPFHASSFMGPHSAFHSYGRTPW